MKNYDGPSFYKKDHPKVTPIHKKREPEKNPKYNLPKSVRTRGEMHEEARGYMETPSTKKTAEPKPSFRRTHTPTSLTQLEGWRNTKKNHSLLAELEARLHKADDTYLLFEEYMDQPEPAPTPTNEKRPQPKPKPKAKNEAKAKRVQKAIKKKALKPSTGLHRSLSNIIAEDEEAMKQRNKNLNSLFTEDR